MIGIKIQDVIPPANWTEAAAAGQIEGSRVILDAVAKAMTLVDADIHKRPSKNCIDIKESVCYKLGIIEALNFVLDLPKEAARAKAK